MLYDADAGDLDVALAGDLMLTRKISMAREPRFLALRDLLNKSDASFANLEGSVRNWDEGTPGITVGTYMTTPPELLDEVKWLGIKIVSCANNHSYDYGEAGLLATIRASRCRRHPAFRLRTQSRRSARARLSSKRRAAALRWYR